MQIIQSSITKDGSLLQLKAFHISIFQGLRYELNNREAPSSQRKNGIKVKDFNDNLQAAINNVKPIYVVTCYNYSNENHRSGISTANRAGGQSTRNISLRIA